MKLSDFDYEIPERLIAQEPPSLRDGARMLVLNRKTGAIHHRKFLDLPEYLGAKDTLILNKSKVIKARLIGKRRSGGKVEVFLLERMGGSRYEALVKATAAQKNGLEFEIDGKLRGRVIGQRPDSIAFEVAFDADDVELQDMIEELGKVPLPPYIRREALEKDVQRYQTVYAQDPGSVAAPTAGLHFTPRVIDLIRARDVKIDFVTLHVGAGTFQPIKTENVLNHKMHTEHFEVKASLLEECSTAKGRGRRIVAVGTTTVRALESAARGRQGSTDLFLYPGQHFHFVDAMLTNFHQPKSSLLVMLAAFVGSRDHLLEAYREAIREEYRFFSYGDCMLVL